MKKEHTTQRHYGPITAIAMIVGIVIGSGIFFKSDDVLKYTGGNLFLGVIVFCIAALSIIFGSLTISELASRTDTAGGIITYTERFCSSNAACAFGWFHTFIYYPTLVAVVSWVIGIYASMLFGLETSLEHQILIGTASVIILYIINILWLRFGAALQNITTVAKLLPLILFAIFGLVLGDPKPLTSESHNIFADTSWIAAITPIAFAFDGWIITTSISHEIKNSKRNLPLALIASPIFILIIYVSYFVGISLYVGPEQIVSMGDAHLDFAAQKLLGHWGSKIMLTFIVVSVIGTVNGLIIGSIRNPQSLAMRKMIPFSGKFTESNKKFGVSLSSAALSLTVSLIWMLVHYLTQKFALLGASDVSEISIVMNYVGYIILYLQVIKMFIKKDVKGVFKGIVIPVLAIIGSAFMLVGGLQNKMFLIYASISIAVVVISLLYYSYSKKSLAK